MAESLLVDPNGKPIKSLKDSPCPKCGAPPNKRVASGGFGDTYLICTNCAYDFNGELKCEKVIV